MNIEIGTFEAKARLSQILQEVKRGSRYTITLRGVPIADLIPSERSRFKDVRLAIEKMRNIRKVSGVSSETLKEWLSEGRR